MNIRQYCTYYRIANEAYEAYYRKRSIGNRLYEEQPNIPEELRDVVYYKRVKFVDVDKLYDIDSPEDFIRFATDHYGELGFSRLNIIASKVPQQGWMIVVSNSYSANVELAIEVATALYKVGVPLLIRDAEKLLRILREEDYVRLIPNTYHNYMGYQEEGTITTPFDMRVQNEIDRFNLVKDAIMHLPQLGNRGSYLIQKMNDKLVEHKQYIAEYGQDIEEVRNWEWHTPENK